MLSKYKHISFDLDGTLVHTIPEYRYSVVPKVINDLGGIVPSEKIIDKFWFDGNREEVIENNFKLNPDVFWKYFNKTDTQAERANHTFPYPDAEAALNRLKQKDKKVSIITSAPKWVAELEFAKINAPLDYFLSVEHKDFKDKPDPSSFAFVLKILESIREETVYIGNSDVDAQFANNAGVGFIYLERKEHEFNEWDIAMHTIHSLDDLFEI